MASPSSAPAWKGTLHGVGPDAFFSLKAPSGSWAWGDKELWPCLETTDLANTVTWWCGMRADVEARALAAKRLPEATAQQLLKTGFAKVSTFTIAWWESESGNLAAVALVGFAGNLELCSVRALETRTPALSSRLARFDGLASVRNHGRGCVDALLHLGAGRPDLRDDVFGLACTMATASCLAAQPEAVRVALRAWEMDTDWALSPCPASSRPRL